LSSIIKKTRRSEIHTDINELKDFLQLSAIYIDKTEKIYRMITKYKNALYCRPRKFGKSTTCSTIEEIFNGNLALFKELKVWISTELTEEQWNELKCPVIRMSMPNISITDTAESFMSKLMLVLKIQERKHKAEIPPEDKKSPDAYFLALCSWLYDAYQKEIVVIIDEYDLPLTGCSMPKPESIPIVIDNLSAFFGVIKCNQEFFRFVFLIGISKFEKVSVFSGIIITC